MKILIAVLHCDRKAHDQLTGLESLKNLDYGEHELIYYFNIQTEKPKGFEPLIKAVSEWEPPVIIKSEDPLTVVSYPVHYDLWNINWSTWWKRPSFDQDQARLFPICIARNMAIDAALDLRCDKLMFVDSDMIVPSNTITKLSSHPYPMVGGLVPGRNNHKDLFYKFYEEGGEKDLGNGLIEVDHGNIGFCMIDRKVFEVLRFRRGPHATRGHLQSDDPNYCFDALHKWGFGRHVLDTTVIPKHIDDNVNDFKNGSQY